MKADKGRATQPVVRLSRPTARRQAVTLVAAPQPQLIGKRKDGPFVAGGRHFLRARKLPTGPRLQS